MNLVVNTESVIHMLGNSCCVASPFFDHHPDALIEIVQLPVPAIAAVVFQPAFLCVLSVLNFGPLKKPMVPVTFAKPMSSVEIGVVLLLA